MTGEQKEMAQGVRFWDFPRHFERIESEVVPEMLSTLRAGDLVMRKQLRQFESDFAAFVGRKHCVGVSSCTDALRLTMQAFGIGPGAEVVTVAHTFIATIAAIHHVGASPVLVDVSNDHLMDVKALEAAVTERTRAIIPVHLNGRTCDMTNVMDVAERNDLVVIEDAAQAVGARFNGRAAGTFGAAACYSFYPAKLLGAFGDAGAVITDDPALADKLCLLRDHGRATKTDVDGWGWNCRLDNVQASVLNVKLRHVPRWIERRREVARHYEEALGAIPEIDTPPAPAEDGRWYDVFQNYVIEVQERDLLQEHLRVQGVETLISWPKPSHQQPGLQLEKFKLPVTERLAGQVLSLPIYPELDEEQVGAVVKAVRTFYGA